MKRCILITISLFCFILSSYGQVSGYVRKGSVDVLDNSEITILTQSGGSIEAEYVGGTFRFEEITEDFCFKVVYDGNKYRSKSFKASVYNDIVLDIELLMLELSGELSGFLETREYFTESEIFVTASDELIIEKGVSVFFDTKESFKIYGSLTIEGEAYDSVSFYGGDTFEWKGVEVEGASAFDVSYLSLSSARGGALKIYNTDTASLKHSALFNNSNEFSFLDEENIRPSVSAIDIYNSGVHINGCAFLYEKSSSDRTLSFDNANITMSNSIVGHTRGDSGYTMMWADSSRVSIVNCLFDNINKSFSEDVTLFKIDNTEEDHFRMYNSVVSNSYVINSLMVLQNTLIGNIEVKNLVLDNNSVRENGESKEVERIYVLSSAGSELDGRIESQEYTAGFVDAAHGNYFLKQNSQLVGKADISYIIDTTDFLANSITKASADIGPIQSVTLPLVNNEEIINCSDTIYYVDKVQHWRVYSGENVLADEKEEKLFLEEGEYLLNYDFNNYHQIGRKVSVFYPSNINIDVSDTVCSPTYQLPIEFVPLEVEWGITGNGTFQNDNGDYIYTFHQDDYLAGNVTFTGSLNEEKSCGFNKLEINVAIIEDTVLLDNDHFGLCSPEKVLINSKDNSPLLWNGVENATSFSIIPDVDEVIVAEKQLGNCHLVDTAYIHVSYGISADFSITTDNSAMKTKALSINNKYRYNWAIDGEDYHTTQVFYNFSEEGIYNICLEIVDVYTGCKAELCKSTGIVFDKHNLGGHIFADAQNVESATVSLYLIAFGELHEVAVTETEEYGFYSFLEVPTGEYTVKVSNVDAVSENEFLPTYYGDILFPDLNHKNIVLNKEIINADVELISTQEVYGQTKLNIGFVDDFVEDGYLNEGVDIAIISANGVLVRKYDKYKNQNLLIADLPLNNYFVDINIDDFFARYGPVTSDVDPELYIMSPSLYLPVAVDGVNETKVYPSITSDYLTIEGIENHLPVAIISTDGKTLTQNTNKGRVDVQSLTPGLYFLSFWNGNMQVYKQFVKK